MLSAAFIFVDGKLDEEFYRLDNLIEKAAQETDGYIGVERWIEPDGNRRNSTYYWRDDEALKSFSQNPTHLEAKRQYKKWYDGFNVIISRIERSYGDGGIQSLLPDERAAKREKK